MASGAPVQRTAHSSLFCVRFAGSCVEPRTARADRSSRVGLSMSGKRRARRVAPLGSREQHEGERSHTGTRRSTDPTIQRMDENQLPESLFVLTVIRRIGSITRVLTRHPCFGDEEKRRSNRLGTERQPRRIDSD
jgi:hypothetical protein